MSAYRKASIRELASAAYELDSGVIEGALRRGDDGDWTIGNAKLNDWLARYTDQNVVLIVASLDDERPVPLKICRTCGSEYASAECPRCREARIRLRGR
jgi:hypothetical protein